MRALLGLLLSGCCGISVGDGREAGAEGRAGSPESVDPQASVVGDPSSEEAPEGAAGDGVAEASPKRPTPAEEPEPATGEPQPFEPMILFSTPAIVPNRILSMCGADDQILWNCSLLEREGAISVCVPGGDAGWVQIRAGHPDQPLVAVPASPEPGASERSHRREETGDGAILTLEIREPGRVATLTIRDAESPSGLLEPALLQLDVHNDSGDHLELKCDIRYGYMQLSGMLEAAMGGAR